MKSTYIYFTDQEIAESVEHFKGELTKVTQRFELIKGLVEKLKLEESTAEPISPKVETKVQPKAKKTATRKAKVDVKTKAKVKAKAVKPKPGKPKTKTPTLEAPEQETITNKVPEADTKYQTQTQKESGTPVIAKTKTTDDAPKTKKRVEEVETGEVDLPLVEKEITDTIDVDQKEELDSFLLKTLKNEIRFFSFDSLVALSCKRYDISGEFQVEDMAKKVRKNLTKLGKKGLIMIKRPREGKRFLYKIN